MQLSLFDLSRMHLSQVITFDQAHKIEKWCDGLYCRYFPLRLNCEEGDRYGVETGCGIWWMYPKSGHADTYHSFRNIQAARDFLSRNS